MHNNNNPVSEAIFFFLLIWAGQNLCPSLLKTEMTPLLTLVPAVFLWRTGVLVLFRLRYGVVSIFK